MATQAQIVAIEKGVKARVYARVSDLHKANQKAELFNGMAKTYRPLADDGKELPPESKKVQFSVDDQLAEARKSLSELIDLTARKDWTNCAAKADIKIGGLPIVSGVPATHLLFLEKQLTDFRSFVAALPVLDTSEDWTYDPASGMYRTPEVKTHRTEKQQKPIVLYDATPEHPAQTQVLTSDELVGHWTTVKHSSAMPTPDKVALLERVDTLLKAVKQAREEANSVDEVPVPHVADAIFDYLLS